jgi:hypothetical protein
MTVLGIVLSMIFGALFILSYVERATTSTRLILLYMLLLGLFLMLSTSFRATDKTYITYEIKHKNGALMVEKTKCYVIPYDLDYCTLVGSEVMVTSDADLKKLYIQLEQQRGDEL